MRSIILIFLVCLTVACTTQERPQRQEETSNYRPVITPPMGVNIGQPNTTGQPIEPGSTTSPQVQRLPKARVKK